MHQPILCPIIIYQFGVKMESYSPTTSRRSQFDTTEYEHKEEYQVPSQAIHERKGHDYGMPHRGERKGFTSRSSAYPSPTYRPPSDGQFDLQEDVPFAMKGARSFSSASSDMRYRKDRGMFHKLMNSKVVEDKGWLAAAMIFGLLVSYPLVIKPLHQVSTDMLSKMRGNLKTGGI